MARGGTVGRSPLRRQVARLATALVVVCWLATGTLLLWAMRLDRARLSEFDRVWRHLSARTHFPTVPQVATINIALTIGWLFAMAALSSQRQRIQKEAMMGFCTQCGYDLFANPSGVCPEYGTPVETYPGACGSASSAAAPGVHQSGRIAQKDAS